MFLPSLPNFPLQEHVIIKFRWFKELYLCDCIDTRIHMKNENEQLVK